MGLAISSNLPPLSSPLELAKFFHETYDDCAKPVAQFDIGRLLRGTMKWAETECAGYGGWPNLRATRDAMAQLVEEMDKWDRRCNRK